MKSAGLVHVFVVALAMLASACSSNSTPPPGSGGAQASGGGPGQGGTTATGGQPGSGGVQGTGGASGTGSSQGGTTANGGAAQPGTGGASASGGRTGAGGGGAGNGGRSGGGGAGAAGSSAGSGGATSVAAGGRGAAGGATGTAPGGSTGTGAGGSAGSSGTGADVVPSAGCGKTPTLKNGTITIQSGGSRKYILRVPDGYDNSHPYRLVIAYAESGSSAQSVADRSYFRFAGFDSKNTIFAAPDAANGAGSWSKTDVDFTDAILAQLQGDLCIDKSRIFATGFSFGGGMSIAVACTRADVFRAVAFFSGADLTGSCPSNLTKPIAYWASQASQDANGMDITNPMTGEYKQAQFAALNGCTAEPNSTKFPATNQPHTCTVYKNCSAGHPTVYCVFNGAHGWEPKDPGQSTSWAPTEAWSFITQF